MRRAVASCLPACLPTCCPFAWRLFRSSFVYAGHISAFKYIACRAGIVQPDAGLKCPFCREFVDGFTDMNGCAPTALLCSLARHSADRPAAAACPLLNRQGAATLGALG